jgi:hypothetical protein
LSRRILFTALAILLIGVVLVSQRGGTKVVAPTAVLHKADLVASVNNINLDAAWSQDGKVTSGGAARLSLDDLRTLTILEGTMTAEYGDIQRCTDFVTPNACVLFADMLGEAVVWFGLVSADAVASREFVTLPGLIDMQDNGNEGILRNGWVVNLATPVKRNCEKEDGDTSSLRDFITRFPDTKSTAMVNLLTDNVVSVKCL